MTEQVDSPAPEAGETEMTWDAAVAMAKGQEVEPEPVDPQEEAEPEADQTSGEEPEAKDIWADASPELKSAYDEAVREAGEFRHKWNSDRNRVSALSRELDKLRKPAPAPAEDADDPIEKTKAALAALREEYPDIAASLDPITEALSGIRGEIEPLKAAQTAANEDRERAFVSEQEASLAARHADWGDVVGVSDAAAAEKFYGWVETQAKWIRDIVSTNAASIVDADGAAEVIARFKEAHGIGQPEPIIETQRSDKRARQLAGSASPPPGRSGVTTSGVPENGDPAKMFDHFARQLQRK